jgi:catechol 2,3-dioxygenase-like lactoylglutathione lyase family enzyme
LIQVAGQVAHTREVAFRIQPAQPCVPVRNRDRGLPMAQRWPIEVQPGSLKASDLVVMWARAQRVEVPVAEPTRPAQRMIVAYFIVSDDVERSRRFYTEVLGGTVVFGPKPTNIALANSFIVINAGGGPTDDKPTVTLETPSDPDRVSSFLNIRVTDIHAVYAEWSARGAQFLTPPKQHQYETRCYIRDPDGYIIEVGQTTDPQGDWWPADWPLPNPGRQSE